MLIQFSTKNYKSVKDEQTISMLSSSLSEYKENTFIKNKTSLLKSAALYGANASGKTKFIEAIAFMKSFIINISPGAQSFQEIPIEKFRLNVINETQPSLFEVAFIHNGMKYLYGFELDTEMVHKEWLYYFPNNRKTELFTRKKLNVNTSVQLDAQRKYIPDLTAKMLFLTVADKWGSDHAKQVSAWFKGQINVLMPSIPGSLETFSLNSSLKEENRKEMLPYIKTADSSILDLRTSVMDITESEVYKKIPAKDREKIWAPGLKHNFWEIITKHQKFNNKTPVDIEDFELNRNESSGTIQMFNLSAPIIDTLKKGGILIVDELDSRLHPLLTSYIIEQFHSKKTNPKNAQLIFSTHSTYLLKANMFRRDQIWFAEKDNYGGTNIFSLAEYQQPGTGSKIRKDASFEKDYLNGKYGGIPTLDDMIYEKE